MEIDKTRAPVRLKSADTIVMALVTYIAKYIHINPLHQSFMLSK